MQIREWIGAYHLKSGGYMAKSEWIYDNYDKARYYLDDNGHYVSGTYKIDGKEHLFQKNTANGFPKFQLKADLQKANTAIPFS